MGSGTHFLITMTITRSQLNRVLLPIQPVERLPFASTWSETTKQAIAALLACSLLYLPFATEVLAAKLEVISTTVASEEAVVKDDPVTVITHLSLADAPDKLLLESDRSVEIEVGESTVEKEAREKREREERERQAELQRQREEAERFALARHSSRSGASDMSFEEARQLTDKYAAQYGVDANLMTSIIACESGYYQYAKNSRSSASGYGQFLSSTWRSTMRAMGEDPNISPFDGEKNIEATAYLLSVRGASPWYSSYGCWAR